SADAARDSFRSFRLGHDADPAQELEPRGREAKLGAARGLRGKLGRPEGERALRAGEQRKRDAFFAKRGALRVEEPPLAFETEDAAGPVDDLGEDLRSLAVRAGRQGQIGAG